MTKIINPPPGSLVAGEPVQALVTALLECKPDLIEGGRYHVDAELDATAGAPLARALMRVEAELLLEDANAIQPGLDSPVRTSEERSADAFLELARRVHDAVTGGRLARSGPRPPTRR